MFGSLGFTEIAFILILALLLFGPKKLPEIGKTLGKGMAEFRRASNELKRTLESEVAEEERSLRQAQASAESAPPLAPLVPISPAGATVSRAPTTPATPTERSAQDSEPAPPTDASPSESRS